MPTVLLIGTLDTKGPEIAYVRDRLQALGLSTIVADSGILAGPLDIVPDVSRAEVARLGGKTIEALRQAGSRGEAVHGMLLGLQRLALNLFRDGRLDGVLCLGGAEGAVLGASAMLSLPIGIPKIIVTPIASGQRRFGPLVGTRDVMVVHSVVDILGLNPISTTIFDNVAAAMAGMLHHGHRLQGDDGRPRVAITMLGNTTKAVMTIRDALARQGLDSVIFHSNGVGGPAMEELAADGLFVGVIDFTTDELADELVGGFHVGRPGAAARGSAGSACRRSSCPAASTSPSTAGPRKCRRACRAGPSTPTIRSSRWSGRCRTRWRSSDGSSPTVSTRPPARSRSWCRPRASRSRTCRAARSGTRTPTPASWRRCARTCAPTSRSRPIRCHINATEFALAVAERFVALLSSKGTTA